jgi:hypothetical protein
LIFLNAYGILRFYQWYLPWRWDMNMQAIIHDIETLPPEKQEEVADFIAFIKTRLEIQEEKSPDTSNSTHSESFFGMWADREAMEDSSLWVRKLRTDEWRAQDA